jgi:ribosomal protein S18 acetylase RimI-like enzyme
MIDYRPLAEFRIEDLEAVMPGYSAHEQYVVTREESADGSAVRFDLALVKLDTPYVHVWEHRTYGMDAEHTASVANGMSLGAYDGERLVGIALYEVQQWNRTLWLWEFAVAESHRGCGIGRAMMDLVADAARKHDCRAIVAETQNTNVPAIRFYRSVGFQVDGIDLSYYTNDDLESGEVAIFMKRKL